jgi:hypothetical protein
MLFRILRAFLKDDIAGAVWSALALVALLFIASNGMFAISLTRRYACSKADKRYALYAHSLWVAVVSVILCAMILHLTGSLKP